MLLRILLGDLFYFAFCHGLLSLAAFFLVGDARPFLTALVLLAPYFAMTAVRLRVKNIGLFFLFHVLLCLTPVLFGGGTPLRGLLFLFLIQAAIRSLLAKLRGNWYPDFSITLVAVGANTALALAMDYFSFPEAGRVLLFWAFVMIIACMICRQTISVDSSLVLLVNSARQPPETTLRFTNFILAAFLLPVGLVGLLAAVLPLDRLGKLLVEAVLALYRFITALLFRFLALFGGEETAEAAPPPPPPDLSELLPAAQESPAWFKIVERIFTVLVCVAIGAFLLYAALRGLKALYLQFYKTKQPGGELRESIGPDIQIEELWGKLRRVRRSLLVVGASEAERVRQRD
jgi:hypothetical protein